MKMKAILPKILLDILLILVLITLYSKNVISLMYHEVAGLAILGLFVIHLVFSRKWFTTMLKKVFSKGLSARARILSVVDVLLIFSWLGVLTTGILVSKKVFSVQISSLNPWHFFISAVAMILTGIHFGLHWKYFWGFLGKKIRLNKVIALALTVIIAGFGVYSIATSSFGRWLVAPFSASAGHGEGFGPGAEGKEFLIETNTENSGLPERTDAVTGTAQETENEAAEESGNRRMGRGDKGEHGQQAFSFTNLLSVIWSAFSIVFMFAAATYGIDWLLKKKKSKAVAGGNRS